ncbi:hypothetical protein EYF80_027949 [Liparis tanakae]|uniref:Uncharacterized protein n=1 Tax=Liparis tanakae TaxID=230148 RepID=A0A4Z2HAL7_9TELE|nr:hypothetical protein EYF80_027949 [Liparis tanakae]
MEQEQTRVPGSLLSLSHPDYTHHPSDASVGPSPSAFPLNTTEALASLAENSHGPGSRVEECDESQQWDLKEHREDNLSPLRLGPGNRFTACGFPVKPQNPQPHATSQKLTDGAWKQIPVHCPSVVLTTSRSSQHYSPSYLQ